MANDNTLLTLTQAILEVNASALPPDSLNPPIGPLPGPFSPSIADASATTLPPEMMNLYNEHMAFAVYQYRI